MSARFGFVLLAAGQSARLGQPKALLPYRGTTLVGHILAQMHPLNCPIIAVTGAHVESIAPAVSLQGVTLAYNMAWEEGMGSSIRCGIDALGQMPMLNGALIVTCDQPAVSSNLFRKLDYVKNATGSDIAACSYAGTYGIPALFDRKVFPELLALRGHSGSKPILMSANYRMATVDFPDGAFDVDTPHDALALGMLR